MCESFYTGRFRCGENIWSLWRWALVVHVLWFSFLVNTRKTLVIRIPDSKLHRWDQAVKCLQGDSDFRQRLCATCKTKKDINRQRTRRLFHILSGSEFVFLVERKKKSTVGWFQIRRMRNGSDLRLDIRSTDLQPSLTLVSILGTGGWWKESKHPDDVTRWSITQHFYPALSLFCSLFPCANLHQCESRTFYVCRLESGISVKSALKLLSCQRCCRQTRNTQTSRLHFLFSF